MKRTLRAGPFVFRDPVLLCGVLYGLLWFDASGFLRIGLWAAFLHECGHVAAYLAMLHEMPTLEVNMTGFCMRTRGKALMPQQTFWLAAAGPLTNALLAADGAQMAAALWELAHRKKKDCNSPRNQVK